MAPSEAKPLQDPSRGSEHFAGPLSSNIHAFLADLFTLSDCSLEAGQLSHQPRRLVGLRAGL